MCQKWQFGAAHNLFFSIFASNSATVDIRNCVDCSIVTRMCRRVNVPNSHAFYAFFMLLILTKLFFTNHIFCYIYMNSVCG